MKLEDVCVVITSHNDADVIGECLESASRFGDKVVVDSFSTDDTAGIARAAGAVVYSRASGDPASQKNWVLTRATGAWVLAVDACEVVSDQARECIEAADAGASGYAFRVENEYVGKVMKSRAASLGEAVRLFRAGSGRFVGNRDDPAGAIVETTGGTGVLNGVVRRRGVRDIHAHFEAINRRTTDSARRYVDGGGRLTAIRLLVHPAIRFWRMFALEGGIRDGARGLMYCMLTAYEVFITYAKAWEIRTAKRRRNRRVPEGSG